MNLILQAIKSMFRGVYNAIEANRTHWDTRKTETVRLTFDGNIDGKETIQFDDYATYVKISEEVPTIEEVIGASISYYNIDGDFSEVVTDDSVYEVFPAAFSIGESEAVMLVFADVVAEDAPPLTKGIWVFREVDESGVPVFYPSSIEYTKTTGELKKLDEKYIPSSIARVSDISSKITVITYVDGSFASMGYDEILERVDNGEIVIFNYGRAGLYLFDSYDDEYKVAYFSQVNGNSNIISRISIDNNKKYHTLNNRLLTESI